MKAATVLPALLLLAFAGAVRAAGPFVESAGELGVAFTHFNGMSGKQYFPEMMGAGAGLLDYDRDGDLDVLLGQGGPLGSAGPAAGGPEVAGARLFQNRLVEDGRLVFRDVTAASGLGVTKDDYNMGVAVGDVDNDGWPDLYFSNLGPDRLLRNQGDGRFVPLAVGSGTGNPYWAVSASFVDVDRDGWLDLFVGNYVQFDIASHRACRNSAGRPDYCSPLSYEPAPDVFYRNLGKGRLVEATREYGFNSVFGAALGVIAADLDGDRFPELLVANDGTANQLWINEQGKRFRNDALMAGVAVNQEGVAEASMGVDLADYDGDGDEDFFVTHLTRETNTLYVNDGNGWFSDGTAASGLGRASFPYTGFGVAWLDYDNDGWLDLFVANGRVTIDDTLRERGDPWPLAQPNQLFRNQAGHFQDVSSGDLTRPAVSRAAAFGDLDNDGDTDIVINNNNGPAHVLINTVGQDNRWLGLDLRNRHGRAAIGARVRVRAGERELWRRVRRDGSYAAANDPRLVIGLGEFNGAVDVEIHWASGEVTRHPQLTTGRYHAISASE
ncbi:MAG: CRTAC1 family protein [Gammaproteobacteria bacterium]|nr:CRTAC1 family protein [Gammaproteobacteria bacterium]